MSSVISQINVDECVCATSNCKINSCPGILECIVPGAVFKKKDHIATDGLFFTVPTEEYGKPVNVPFKGRIDGPPVFDSPEIPINATVKKIEVWNRITNELIDEWYEDEHGNKLEMRVV